METPWGIRTRALLYRLREDRRVYRPRGTLRVTDAAAGILICTEAGGSVSDLDGDPLVFPDEVTIGRCMVATNGVMHRKVIEYLR